MYQWVVFAHIIAAIAWIGGMLFVALVLVPVLRRGPRELRAALLDRVGRRFRTVGWAAIAVLLVTGVWMILSFFGGFAHAPMYINIMMALGLLMVALYAWLFHGPWLKFKRAVDAGDWPTAGAHLNRIRQIIALNLPLGLIVVIVGGTGQYWG